MSDKDSEISHDDDNFSQQDIFEDDVKEGSDVNKYKKSTIQTKVIQRVAVKEKIVVCIDSSQDAAVGYVCTGSNQNQNVTESFAVRNEALRVFFINKLAIANDTEFAILSISPGKVETISRFTTDVNSLISSLSHIKIRPVEDSTSEYDITPIFSSVLSSITLTEDLKSKNFTPDFLLRVIFIYNNSHCVPCLNVTDKSYATFLESPQCILDVVYLHEAQSEYNKVMDIFEQFGKIVSSHSYLFESSRDVTLVFNMFAKLLSHPYQRISQELWEF